MSVSKHPEYSGGYLITCDTCRKKEPYYISYIQYEMNKKMYDNFICNECKNNTMQQPQTGVAPSPVQIAEAKANNWKNFGYNLALMEIDITHKANITPFIPQSIADIPQAEAEILRIKELHRDIEATRKKDTSILDQLQARLMQPEKALLEMVKNISAALIPLKQAATQAANANAAKAKELQLFKENVIRMYNDSCSLMQKQLTARATDAYNYAIDNVPANEVHEYLRQRKDKVTEQTISFVYPADVEPDKQAIIDEVYKGLNMAYFVKFFHDYIDTLFVDFEIAKANADTAKQRAIASSQQTQNQIEENRQQNNAAAAIEAASEISTPQAVPPGKALKQVFELQMEATQDSVMKIIKAFIANNGWVHLRVKDLMNLKVSQMGDALCKMKNEDNKFVPDGIVFKPVDKL